nr:MAG TPA: hypothetical protein [Caudoviricetes sp.]
MKIKFKNGLALLISQPQCISLSACSLLSISVCITRCRLSPSSSGDESHIRR